jgi:hypothetical protein
MKPSPQDETVKGCHCIFDTGGINSKIYCPGLIRHCLPCGSKQTTLTTSSMTLIVACMDAVLSAMRWNFSYSTSIIGSAIQ